MMRLRVNFLALSLFIIASCGGDEAEYAPKPKGYFRIETPSKQYKQLDLDCPFTFEYNTQAIWRPHKRVACWGDVYYPSIKAQLQLTYKQVTEENLDTLLNDARELVYKHVVKADGIKENLVIGEEEKVYGIYYQLSGDAATSSQFFVTDSTDHYLRGVLYFFSPPNADSLQPVNNFMADEIVHLIETLKWQGS